MAKKGKQTTSIQVSRPLDLVITRYAAEHGIAKHEAADRIFSVLYPDGRIPEGPAPIAPEETEAPEAVGEPPEVEQPEDVSDELTKTVKDLRTVNTIRALQKGLTEDKEEEEWHLTPQQAFEMKKIEKMFGGEGNSQKQVTARDLATLQTNILAQMEKLLAEKESQAKASEAEFYKKRLEEREAAEQRAQEMANFLEPIQQNMKTLNERIETLKTELKPESKTPPTSAELEAIRTLGGSIKEAIAEIKPKGGTETQTLTSYLDGLTALMERINEFAKKGEATPGEFDWRTAAISTAGEVGTEMIRAYRDIEAAKGESEEEAESEEARGLSAQVVERRVYNYAMKKIAAGELSIDPYKAGEELGLTPNQVWKAVQSLQKRGALKVPEAKKKTVKKEKSETEVRGEGSEGEGEGEIGPLTES